MYELEMQAALIPKGGFSTCVIYTSAPEFLQCISESQF